MSASASSARRPLLAGRIVDLHVAARFPAATYLADPRTGRVLLVVVTADGIALPNAVVLASRVGDRPFARVRDHDVVQVGENRLLGPWSPIVVARWWSPRPVLPSVSPGGLQTSLDAADAEIDRQADALPPDLADRFHDLTTAVSAGDVNGAVAAVDRLVGFGTGLTPSGDDLLAGFVAAVCLLTPVLDADRHAAVLPPAVSAVATRMVDRGDTMTTAISAALLRHAAVGEVCAPAGALLRTLTGRPALTGTDGAVARLLRVGATSGRDLAVGLLAGARLATTLRAATLRSGALQGDTPPPQSFSTAATHTLVSRRT